MHSSHYSSSQTLWPSQSGDTYDGDTVGCDTLGAMAPARRPVTLAPPLEEDMCCQCEWMEITVSWLMAIVSAAIHVAALLHHLGVGIWNTASLEFDEFTDDMFAEVIVGNLWRHLTGWSFVVQLMFLAIRCTSDFASGILYLFGPGSTRSLAKARIVGAGNFLFQSLVFPTSTLVFTVFWLLYTIDRGLVYPGGVDEGPSWWNHAMYSVPAGVAIVELLFSGSCHCWKRKRELSLYVLHMFLVVYDITSLFGFKHDHNWYYPVYIAVPKLYSCLAQLCVMHMLACLFYFLGDQMGTYLHACALAKKRGSNSSSNCTYKYSYSRLVAHPSKNDDSMMMELEYEDRDQHRYSAGHKRSSHHTRPVPVHQRARSNHRSRTRGRRERSSGRRRDRSVSDDAETDGGMDYCDWQQQQQLQQRVLTMMKYYSEEPVWQHAAPCYAGVVRQVATPRRINRPLDDVGMIGPPPPPHQSRGTFWGHPPPQTPYKTAHSGRAR